MKATDIVNATLGITELRKSNVVIPTKLNYRLGVILRQLQPIAEEFEQNRSKLIEANGTPIPDQPGQFTIPAEKTAEIVKLINELSAHEHPDVEPVKISIDEFPADLPANIFASLEPLVAPPAG